MFWKASWPWKPPTTPPKRPARARYVQHLDKERSLVAAAKWLSAEKLEHEEFHPPIQRALEHAVKPLTRYRCAACGFEARQHFWQCPGCQTWDSYPARRVEDSEPGAPARSLSVFVFRPSPCSKNSSFALLSFAAAAFAAVDVNQASRGRPGRHQWHWPGLVPADPGRTREGRVQRLG